MGNQLITSIFHRWSHNTTRSSHFSAISVILRSERRRKRAKLSPSYFEWLSLYSIANQRISFKTHLSDAQGQRTTINSFLSCDSALKSLPLIVPTEPAKSAQFAA